MTTLFGRRRETRAPRPVPVPRETPPPRRPQGDPLPKGAWHAGPLDPEFDPCGAGPLAGKGAG